MIVCICHRVSDKAIVQAAQQGCLSFDDLQGELRVASACGACRQCAQEVFERACTQTCPAARHHPMAPPHRHAAAAA